ncbi:MAG: hypothetical protein OXF79_21000 [Chloroflexi bacterium]|nr:hypothetical protein [Chloroflexota bacterium]
MKAAFDWLRERLRTAPTEPGKSTIVSRTGSGSVVPAGESKARQPSRRRKALFRGPVWHPAKYRTNRRGRGARRYTRAHY